MATKLLSNKNLAWFSILKSKEWLLGGYFLLFILGLNLGISAKFYNEFRVLEILLLLMLAIYSLIHNRFTFSKYEVFFFTSLGAGYFFWTEYLFILVDMLTAYLLYKNFYLLNYNNTITKFIVISSFLIFLLFPISLIGYIQSGAYDPIWYPMPWNIRVYDSYFLITSVLATWLYLHEQRFGYLYFAFSCLAFLAILLDAGRSATLAYSVFIFIIAIFSKSARLKVLLAYGASWLSYLLISYLAMLNTSQTTTDLHIARVTTSLRYDLWVNAFQCWQSQPIFGCGFYQKGNFEYLAAHPHNLVIQAVSETGLIGLGFLSLVIFAIARNIDWNIKKNSFVIAALIAIAVDMSLSGVHIYPITQIALLWLFVFLLKNPAFSYGQKFNELSINSDDRVAYAFNAFVYIAIAAVFIYIFANTAMLADTEEFTPPRFWEYGYQLL